MDLPTLGRPTMATKGFAMGSLPFVGNIRQSIMTQLAEKSNQNCVISHIFNV
jgi:hypothetical protein